MATIKIKPAQVDFELKAGDPFTYQLEPEDEAGVALDISAYSGWSATITPSEGSSEAIDWPAEVISTNPGRVDFHLEDVTTDITGWFYDISAVDSEGDDVTIQTGQIVDVAPDYDV
jgi:hypothetical protein